MRRGSQLVCERSYFHGTNSLLCQANTTSLLHLILQERYPHQLVTKGSDPRQTPLQGNTVTGMPPPKIDYTLRIPAFGKPGCGMYGALPLVSCRTVDGPPCDDKVTRFKIR